MNRKWYIKTDDAEGCRFCVIDLSDEELAIVKRYINAEEIANSYGGTDGIIENLPFNTKEEAIQAILIEDRQYGYLNELIARRNNKEDS